MGSSSRLSTDSSKDPIGRRHSMSYPSVLYPVVPVTVWRNLLHTLNSRFLSSPFTKNTIYLSISFIPFYFILSNVNRNTSNLFLFCLSILFLSLAFIIIDYLTLMIDKNNLPYSFSFSNKEHNHITITIVLKNVK